MSYLDNLVESRVKDREAAKAILDAAAAENRELTAEENEAYDRANAEMDRKEGRINEMLADEKRSREIDEALASAEELRVRNQNESGKDQRNDFNKQIREMRNGQSVTFKGSESRAMATTSTGAPVPTDFYDTIVDIARDTGPMLDANFVTLLRTDGGNPLQVPTQATFSTPVYGTEGTAKSTSEPTFNALSTLNGYVEAFMMYVSEELLDDATFDLLPFLARQAGNAIGYKANSWLTVGTGTTQPTGIVTAASSAVPGGTGVSGAFTYANIVDLIYSLDPAVRASRSFAVMGATSSMAAIRKLTDPAGRYIWEPSLQAGQPSTVLGYKMVENVAMVAPAASARSLVAGDLSAYWVRLVNGVQLKRSDDYKFAEGQVAFRASLRVDGLLTQATHVKAFVGSAG